LNYAFPFGTQLTSLLELQKNSRAYTDPSLDKPTSRLAGYGVSLRLGVLQPLMRGQGRTFGEVALRRARIRSRRRRARA